MIYQPASQPASQPAQYLCQLAMRSVRRHRWPVILSGLMLFTTFPTFATYVPLTGVSQLWKGGNSDHGCVITSSGGVKCWGRNDSGQLGDNSTTNRLTPVDVYGLTSGITAIALGSAHTCALTSSGGVKCWGLNAYGQLGDNTTTGHYIPVDVVNSTKTGLLSGVTAISAGWHHTCAVTSTSGVQCWGYNAQGELGDNTNTNRLVPVDVIDVYGTGLLNGEIAIASGAWHSCALSRIGGVQCWGDNQYGQLGDNTITQYNIAVDVKNSTGASLLSGASMITAGGSFSCALMSSGGVQCWGRNTVGQLGDTTTTDRYLPTSVKNTTNTGFLSGVSAIVQGTAHTCALMFNSSVLCWGENQYGQLGDNTTIQRNIPVDVRNSAGTGLLSGVSAIATENGQTCALTSSGGVQCWGNNDLGKLGNNSTTHSSIPVDVLVSGQGGHPGPNCDANKCSYTNISFDKAGFYIAQVRLGTGSQEGFWGLEANTASGANAGGFNAGTVLKENGLEAGFVGFYLGASEQVNLTVQEYSGLVPKMKVVVERQDLHTGQRTTIYGPTFLASGDSDTTSMLAPGFYIASATSQNGNSRGRFGIQLLGQSFTGGVNVGGWIDNFTGGNGEGFGGFLVASPQNVNLNLLFGNNYGTKGAGPLTLTILYQKTTGEREFYWSPTGN